MNAVINRIFTGHPATVGESYGTHLRFATGTGASLLLAGLAAIVHGLLPCLFESTSSTAVLRLAQRMEHRFPDHPVFRHQRG